MKLSNFINGLEIAKKYYRGHDGYHVGADHDVVYLYATHTGMNSQDIQAMIDNGWFQSCEDTGLDGGEEFTAGHYVSNASWRAYT
jgi:hypothetical protein